MFQLHPTLESDTFFIKHLVLSDLLLMNDSRFPWFILVPRRENTIEIFDLPDVDQELLWKEVLQVSKWMKNYFSADKMNIATLGNIVSQLHVHIIARTTQDAAWPNPVWGQGLKTPYNIKEINTIVTALID